MTDFTGRIVDLLDKNTLRRVWVRKHAASKLAVVTEHGRQEKAAQKAIVVAHDGTVDEARSADQIRELNERVTKAQGDVDVTLLWEFVESEPRDYSAAELAELIFSPANSVQESAVFLALCDEAKHFKRSQQTFAPRERAQVEELALGERRRQEREAREAALDAWIEETLDGAASPYQVEKRTDAGAPDDAPNMAAELEQILAGDNTSVLRRRIVAKCGVERSVDVAFQLLRRMGGIPGDVDPFAVRGGVPLRFDPEALVASENLEPASLDGREDWTGVPTVSIDDASTREIDDALSLRMNRDGSAELAIHIADLAAFVEPGSLLDDVALDRAVTTYLPRGSTTMLPERIGCDLASLRAGIDRPAVTLVAQLSRAGQVESTRFTRSVVRVDHRWTYQDADASIAAEAGADLIDAMQLLDAFSRHRESVREANGAIMLDRADLRVAADVDGTIEVDVVMPNTPAYRLVGESMIFFNSEAARVFVENEVPAIFRVQEVDAPAEAPEDATDSSPSGDASGDDLSVDSIETAGLDESQGRKRSALEIEALVRRLKPSRSQLTPGPHGGLGLDAYVQITSPLRRYADALCQRQLVAQIAGESPPYTNETLSIRSASIDETARARTVLERRAKRFYILTWLAGRDATETLEATALRSDASGQTVCELVSWPVRGTLVRGQSAPAGATIQVRVSTTDPMNGVLKLSLVGD